jgi:hypothetical protein
MHRRVFPAVLFALALLTGCSKSRDTMLFHAGARQRSLLNDVKEVFLSHAAAVGNIPRVAEGLENDGGKATDALMSWLVNAARAVKDESLEANTDTVGPLMKEAVRQRRTTRAGS